MTIELYINKDSGTPVRQAIISSNLAAQANYYDWKIMDKVLILPGIIKIDFPESDIKGEYKIGKAKKNPSIPLKYYLPLYKL